MHKLTKTFKWGYVFGFFLCAVSTVAAMVEPLRLMSNRCLLISGGFLLILFSRTLQHLRDALLELPAENKVRHRILHQKVWKDKIFLVACGLTGPFFLIVAARILIR